MSDWLSDLPTLDPTAQRRLGALTPFDVPKGHVVFRPGDRAEAFSIVLTGRVEVFLTGPSGREVLLYAVEPGQSCVQTTLGLLGDAPYSAEAIAASELRVVMVPRALFASLMSESEAFRALVFRAFATRMTDVVTLLERVAFQSVECRLAALLLERAEGGRVEATQGQIAVLIGTAREVISRRLDAMARAGLIETARGTVIIRDVAGLERLASLS
ncbi:Crp/Fnr family transcriptional regulator [Pseudothioclava arenosa]|uniref:Crp/Fnr family transcriptional regulator n=1 Tax=Pseudothioclava arenosa TaxID=1795308 RepID=A0A2A4CTT6_9RHOB|nr:Crp/Fnr family transcriptional regulator [Pseudothioclava arenosa]PCD77672.1 Crp/Fnr family transcriptional regulator [Pseudothioclava arenosa]